MQPTAEKDTKALAQDLRGFTGLTVDAISGLTDIVELMHQAFMSLGGRFMKDDNYLTSGLAGVVYQKIRTINYCLGYVLDRHLQQLNGNSNQLGSTRTRETILAIVNGVLGDHLEARDNPLAIPMQFRRAGKPLNVTRLAESCRKSNKKVLILIHGSCMNDLQWQRKGHDHGAKLEQELNYEVIYLHYNTGLHVSDNGSRLSELLENLSSQLPSSTSFHILAHSLGGLVSRSACHHASSAGFSWYNRLKQMIFLGTPHHGALLERGGNWFETFLKQSPYSAPLSRLAKIRSCGVTDLRYGNILQEHWHGEDRFELSEDKRLPCPLPKDVNCYVVAATRAITSTKFGDELIGDGLVTIGSALGHHKNPDLHLYFPDKHQWVGRGISHLDLLNHPEVYKRLGLWLS